MVTTATGLKTRKIQCSGRRTCQARCVVTPTRHTPAAPPTPPPAGSSASREPLAPRPAWTQRQPSEVASGMELPAHPSSGSGSTPSKAKKTLVQPLGSPLPSLAQGQNPQCGFMLRVKRSKHITWGPPPRFPQSPDRGALWGDGHHAALPPCMGGGHPRRRKAVGEDASTWVQADLPARPAQTRRGTEIKSSPCPHCPF